MKFIKGFVPLSLLAFSLSTINAYADHINKIPLTPTGFGISLSGIFLKPGASDLIYAVHTKPLPLPDPSWTQETVDPDYHFTFQAALLYTFSSHADQVKLNWLYLNSTDSASNSATGTESVAPPYAFGPLAQQLRGSSANSTAKFKANDVNFVYSHLFNFAFNLQLAPFIGIDTAYLKQDITSNFAGTSNNQPYSITSYNDSKYIGAGPRLGIDTTYFITHGLGIIAEIAASILVGPMESNTHFLSFGAGNTTPGYTGLANNLTETRVVPEIEGKLGLTYLKSFSSGSEIIVELGYLFSTYVNGINQVLPSSLVPNAFNNGVIAIETSNPIQSNFDLSGPYLKLAYLFNT